jgi:hypothetical protein
LGQAENAVTKAVKLAIAQRGDDAVFVRVQAGSFHVGEHFMRGAEAGTADLIGVYRGIPVAFEVKTATGRQSKSQEEWSFRWRVAGGVYEIVRGYEDALRTLNDIDRQIEVRSLHGTHQAAPTRHDVHSDSNRP